MDTSKRSDPIAWGRVRDRLPGTAHELLEEIQLAYEKHPDDAARAIERALRSRIAQLRTRFEKATQDQAS